MSATEGIGATVFKRRKAQGLTQEQLGDRLGVSPQAVSKWEKGESVPDTGLLPELCRVLNVSSDMLLGIDIDIGIGNLLDQLSKTLPSLKDEKGKRTLDALGMMLPGIRMGSIGKQETSIHYIRDANKGISLSAWSERGLAVYTVPPDGDSRMDERVMEGIRTLLHPPNWRIARILLDGGRSVATLSEELGESGDATQSSLDSMMDSGLVTRDSTGYHLNGTGPMAWAILLQAMGIVWSYPGSLSVKGIRETEGR